MNLSDTQKLKLAKRLRVGDLLIAQVYPPKFPSLLDRELNLQAKADVRHAAEQVHPEAVARRRW